MCDFLVDEAQAPQDICPTCVIHIFEGNGSPFPLFGNRVVSVCPDAIAIAVVDVFNGIGIDHFIASVFRARAYTIMVKTGLGNRLSPLPLSY